MFHLASRLPWTAFICSLLIDGISAVLVTYRATADSKDWTFTQPFEFHTFDPRIDDIVGSCISIDVVELSYGGGASITFTGSAVFLHIVLVTTDLSAAVRLHQGSRVVAQDLFVDPAGSEPTCNGDRFSFTDLDPNQPSTLDIKASDQEQIGGPPHFIIQGIQVIVPNATFTSSTPTAPATRPSGPAATGSTVVTMTASSIPQSDVPPANSSPTARRGTNAPLIAGAAAGGAVGCLAVLFAAAAILRCRRRRNARRQLTASTQDGPSSTASAQAHRESTGVFDPTSLIARSPSGKVTTMSAGPSSPPASDGRPYSAYTMSMAGTSELSSERLFSLPSESAGSSSLNRAGTMNAAPPAYGDVVSQRSVPLAPKSA